MYGFSLEKEKKAFFVAKNSRADEYTKLIQTMAKGCGLKGEAMEANRAGEDIKMPRFR